jgi:Na+/H+ antiporter NhaD/arsenite permease-like protein
VPILLAIFGFCAVMYAIQHSIIALPFLAPGQELYFPIILTFIVGYGVIVLEEQTEINKAATALVLGVLVWVFVGTGLNLTPEQFDKDIKETLEDVSEVVFFLLGALTIVEIMDAHKGFDIITKLITQTKTRDLLVVISVLTFVLSSVLNNLTVVIVMISLLQKIIKDTDLRLKIGGIVVVASNAGGAWTPIGDITTTMLYIGGQVTTVPLIANLLVPSIACLIGTLGYEYVQMDGEQTFERPTSGSGGKDEEVPNGQQLVFWSGLVGMVSVPVFTALTQCPAWSGMMLVLGLLGVMTSLLHPPEEEKYNLKGALTRVEVPDALFFLGVLFAVGGLERVGLLKAFAVQLSSLVPSDALVAILLGFASAVVDNVPLVAASQGMYDLGVHPANEALWNLICYCAATGGSLLVIGSAAGVAFMGMEKEVSFGWYFSKITPPALVGYFFGVAAMIAQQSLGLAVTS